MSTYADLRERAVEELHEFAWSSGWPIANRFAISAFANAFSDVGYNVSHDETGVGISFDASIGLLSHAFNSKLSVDEISRGWGNGPASSPRKLYDGICGMFDRAANQTLGKNLLPQQWFSYRTEATKMVRVALEKRLLSDFRQNMEHVLLRVDGTYTLAKPTVFEQTFNSYPFEELYEQAALHKLFPEDEGETCGPDEYSLMTDERIWDNLKPGEYFPSDSTITSVFRANFMYRTLLYLGVDDTGELLRKCTTHSRDVLSSRTFKFPEAIENGGYRRIE